MGTNKLEEKSFDIVGGPNRSLLFDACKYAYDKNIKFTVNFAVAMGYTLPKSDPRSAYVALDIKDIKICGIEHEDGSGESFNLHGYCQTQLDSFGINDRKFREYKFKAYYNSKNRSGTIRFLTN